MKAIRDLIASILIVAVIVGAVSLFSVIGAVAGTVISLLLAVLFVYIFVHDQNKDKPP